MSAGLRDLSRRGTMLSSSSVTGAADAAPGSSLEAMELLPMAKEALGPLAGGVVHVCAGALGCPSLEAVATQAHSGGHVGSSLNFVRLPRDVSPHLLKVVEQVVLMAGVTCHPLMLTIVPLIPGCAHRVTRPAEARIFFREVIGIGNTEHSQPDSREAQGRQHYDRYPRQPTASKRLPWDSILPLRLGHGFRSPPPVRPGRQQYGRGRVTHSKTPHVG